MHKTSFQSWTLFLKASENDFGEKSCKYLFTSMNCIPLFYLARGAAHSANFDKKVHKPQSYWTLAVARVKKANHAEK